MSDRWLATVSGTPPSYAPAVADPEPEPLDPELLELGRAMIEATTRLLVEKRDRELATGKRFALRLRPPRYDPHGEPECVLSIVLEQEG